MNLNFLISVVAFVIVVCFLSITREKTPLHHWSLTDSRTSLSNHPPVQNNSYEMPAPVIGLHSSQTTSGITPEAPSKTLGLVTE